MIQISSSEITNNDINPTVKSLYFDKITLDTNELDNYLTALQTNELFNRPTIINMIKEIQIVCDEQCKYVSKKWTQTIEDNYADITFYSFDLHSSDNGKIIISIDVIKAHTAVPKLYNSQQVCSRSGRRKYRVAGPRKTKCSVHYTERGINENEIKYVTNFLSETIQKSLLHSS